MSPRERIIAVIVAVCLALLVLLSRHARLSSSYATRPSDAKTSSLSALPPIGGNGTNDDARNPLTVPPPPNDRPSNITNAWNARFAVRPIRTCRRTNSTGPAAKLVFIHVFKAAGSTLSSFFGAYSERCHAAYARLISCTKVDSDTVRDGGNWKHCTLKRGITRSGGHYETGKKGKINNTFIDDSLDIVGGHMKLGTCDAIKSKVRYVSFFRDAAAKYVSAVVFVKGRKRMTGGEIVEHVKKTVRTEVTEGNYYSRYSSYLLTPSQLEETPGGRSRKDKGSVKAVTEKIMDNLVRYDVIVGMVERMSESLEILRHVLDDDREATDVFTKYGMRDENGESAVYRSNGSPISASVLLKEFKKDEEFYANLTEYLKFEQRITDFAMELHMRQYEAISN